MKTSGVEKLVRWFIFTVVISMLPLAGSYFGLQVDRRVPSLEMLVGRGELLLISATIAAAAAIGELIPAGRERAVRKLIAAGSCMVIVVLSSLYFAIIQARSDPDTSSIATISIRVFVGMLFAAGYSIYFAHQEVA